MIDLFHLMGDAKKRNYSINYQDLKKFWRTTEVFIVFGYPMLAILQKRNEQVTLGESQKEVGHWGVGCGVGDNGGGKLKIAQKYPPGN